MFGLIDMGFLFVKKYNTSILGPVSRSLAGPESHIARFPEDGWSLGLGDMVALPRRAGKSKRPAGPEPSSGLHQAALGGPEGFIWIF